MKKLLVSSGIALSLLLVLAGGTLTLQSDGTLMREHKTPDFTASGVLTRK